MHHGIYADAIDSYDKVNKITGEITGELSRPMPRCGQRRPSLRQRPCGICQRHQKQNLDAMVKAGLNGMTMPRRFGGLNFPITRTMCAGNRSYRRCRLWLIWSLQDCIETLYEFGNEDQHSRSFPASAPVKPCPWT